MFRPAKQSYISKKEFEVDEVRRAVIGAGDQAYPTRDAVAFHVRNMGPRFGNMMSAFSRLLTTDAAVIDAAGIVSSAQQLGITGLTTYPYTDSHSCPLAVRAHYEVVELCNLNKFPVWMTVQMWKWKPGMNYKDGQLDTEVLRSVSDSGGMLMWDGANQHTTWHGVAVPASFSNANHFTIESLFGQRKTVFDRMFVRMIWSRKVLIPASGVYKIRKKVPRMWPVYPENATHLDYLCKNKVDWALAMSWHSACGMIPVATPADDPGADSIHTEKPIIAMRIFRRAVGVRYAYEPAVQVLVRDNLQFTQAVPARTSTNRAAKPQVHKDAEIVAGIPGQAVT